MEIFVCEVNVVIRNYKTNNLFKLGKTEFCYVE